MKLLTVPTFDLKQTVIPVAEAPTMPCPNREWIRGLGVEMTALANTMPRWEPFAVAAIAVAACIAYVIVAARLDAARDRRRVAAVQDLIAAGLTAAEAESVTL